MKKVFKTIRGKVTLWSIIIVGILNIILSVFIYMTINKKLESSIQGYMKTIPLTEDWTHGRRY